MSLALNRLEARGKGILLLHDIHPKTVAALPGLLKELKDNGFHIVQVVPAAVGSHRDGGRSQKRGCWLRRCRMTTHDRRRIGGATEPWPEAGREPRARRRRRCRRRTPRLSLRTPCRVPIAAMCSGPSSLKPRLPDRQHGAGAALQTDLRGIDRASRRIGRSRQRPGGAPIEHSHARAGIRPPDTTPISRPRLKSIAALFTPATPAH